MFVVPPFSAASFLPGHGPPRPAVLQAQYRPEVPGFYDRIPGKKKKRTCRRTEEFWYRTGHDDSSSREPIPSLAHEFESETFRYALAVLVNDLIDQAVLLGLLRRHDKVALHVLLDFFE